MIIAHCHCLTLSVAVLAASADIARGAAAAASSGGDLLDLMLKRAGTDVACQTDSEVTPQTGVRGPRPAPSPSRTAAADDASPTSDGDVEDPDGPRPHTSEPMGLRNHAVNSKIRGAVRLAATSVPTRSRRGSRRRSSASNGALILCCGSGYSSSSSSSSSRSCGGRNRTQLVTVTVRRR
jgi:hypothetical protein